MIEDADLQPVEAFDPLRSLTRLAIGAGSMGAEWLVAALRDWEARVSQAPPAGAAAPDDAAPGGDVRDALVGAVFEWQRRTRVGAEKLAGAGMRGWRVMSGALSAFGGGDRVARRVGPIREQASRELERLVRLGREEYGRSRLLAATAFAGVYEQTRGEIVHSALESVTEAPEVRDLIRSQSTGMAEDLLGDVRVRAADTDDRLERVVRGFLRRRPRGEAPVDSEGPTAVPAGGPNGQTRD